MCLIYISLFLPLGQHTVKTPGGWMALWKFIAQVFFHFRSMSATNEPFLLNWGNEGKKLYSSSSLASTDGHISFKKGSKTFCWKYGRQLLNYVKGKCSFILLRSLKIKKKLFVILNILIILQDAFCLCECLVLKSKIFLTG